MAFGSRNRQAREIALKRRYGMLPERREEVQRLLEGQLDWRTICRFCGEERQGSPSALRKPCPCREGSS